jgi:hypothetical protein
MTTKHADTTRPEPGIATDEELREAVSELRDAVADRCVDKMYAERLSPDAYATSEWSEVIKVRLSDHDMATKETVINNALLSDAPVRLREIREDRVVEFYPTNQAE